MSAFLKRSVGIVCSLGAILVIIGGWMQDEDTFRYLADHFSILDTVLIMSYLLMAVGTLIILVSALGCLADNYHSLALARTFFIFVFIIGLTLLGVCIWAMAAKSYVQNMSVIILNKAVHKYNQGGISKTIMDSVQEKFECCGSDQGVEDYLSRNETIPRTCQSEFYETPCDGPFCKWLEQKLNIVGGLCLGIDVLLALGIFFAWSVDNKDETKRLMENIIRCAWWCCCVRKSSSYGSSGPL